MREKVCEGFEAAQLKESLAAALNGSVDSDGDVNMEEAVGGGWKELPISHEGGEWEDIGVLWSQMLKTKRCAFGFFPCSPLHVSVAISTAVLELYRILFLRCPRLTIQPFIKTPFRSYLSEQFTIAFDLYLDILRLVRLHVAVALKRDSPDWRLANACPCCLYELEDKEDLDFRMLFTMDGNDSLKRMHRQERISEEEGDRMGPSKKRKDFREGGGDYFLSRAQADKWDIHADPSIPPPVIDPKATPACDRWHNSKESNTHMMWKVYNETGIFIVLCCHGFVLIIADMVQSGELMKYALAILFCFFGVLPKRLGGGYDIGCSFEVTLKNSPLGPRALEEVYSSLVGLFHGHAHNRLCQLRKLGTYITGMGLEDLEGCERFFSASNALATAICHSSIFHRRQAIAEYSRHYDSFHMYASLSTFLASNYKQALDIQGAEAGLKCAMKDMGIHSTDVFAEWLSEELEYLKTRVPLKEMLEMEYYQTLVKFSDASDKLSSARHIWLVNSHLPNQTKALEAKRHHAQEAFSRLLEEVQSLESRLSISPQDRWLVGDENWLKNAQRKCLDCLEGLIVERMLELTKMNMSQTGYKLRKHIGNALKTRSQAICSALDSYNNATKQLSPPRQHLDWATVVEYAFLSEFELLRDSRQDIREKPWATPGGQALLDQHFKILQARKEITRCNVEICRLVTKIHDEKEFLDERRQAIHGTNPTLAHQISVYQAERGRLITSI
ncbi:hypothetical protein C8J56DRAFT_1007167 [Mycena floridula]|nr:hypothetical protein C8J56DRAFT_1007167 [Mycena floridula]